VSTLGNGESLSPAERRLAEHLEIVRPLPPSTGGSLARRVVRRARHQRALREPLRLIGSIAAAVVEGIGGLLGVQRGRRR